MAAVARGEQAELPAELDPDAQEVVILAVLRGVRDAVDPGFRGVVGGSPEGTLLHHAAWVGDPELVSYLLTHGADPLARSDADFSTPLAWAALGSQYHRIPGRDYVAVAELLVAAGAKLESRFEEVAAGPLYDYVSGSSAAWTPATDVSP